MGTIRQSVGFPFFQTTTATSCPLPQPDDPSRPPLSKPLQSDTLLFLQLDWVRREGEEPDAPQLEFIKACQQAAHHFGQANHQTVSFIPPSPRHI